MRTEDKPSPEDDNKGCMIHDEICLDEQMKAGCTVELFICYNCRYMYERLWPSNGSDKINIWRGMG